MLGYRQSTGISLSFGIYDWYLTFPLTSTGRFFVACIPRIADCGGFNIGVPMSDPKTPPFDTVNVPPVISSMASLLLRALCDENKDGFQYVGSLQGKR